MISRLVISRLVACGLLCAGTSLRAEGTRPPAAPEEQTEFDLFKLEDILHGTVVTASGGVEEERSITSANVFVITSDEIAIHGWRSLTEVLAQVPGLYVVDDLAQPSVGVRGVTPGLRGGTRIVKLMINGHMVSYRPDLTAFIGPELIPIEAVERVEVAKGPLSALYGANAFLATVNVITRKPEEGVHAEAAGRAHVLGSSGGGGGSGVISLGKQGATLLIAASGDQIDRSGLSLSQTFAGQNPTDPLFSRQSTNDLALPVSLFAQLSLTSEKLGTLVLEGGFQNHDTKGEFQINSLLTHRTRLAAYNLWTNARYLREWRKLAFSINLGYSRGRPTPDQQSTLSGANGPVYQYNFRSHEGYDAISTGAELSWTPLGTRLSFKLGMDFDYSFEKVLFYTQTTNQAEGSLHPGDQIDLIPPDAARRIEAYQVGAYLQVTSIPAPVKLPGLHLTGNARVDKIAYGSVDFPTQFSWRAAIAYRWKHNWVTKLIGGHAFQTPSSVLLFSRGGFGSVNNVIGSALVGNQLKPQTVDSVEAVVSGLLFGHLAVEVAGYFQEIGDKIEFLRNGNSFIATNRGIRRSTGVELVASATHRWFTFYLRGSFDWGLDTGEAAQNPSPQYPSLMGLTGIDVHLPRIYLHGNVQLRVVGPRGGSQSNIYLNNNVVYTLPTYASLDVTLSTVGWTPFGAGHVTRLLFAMRNLVGEQHFEAGFSGYDIPTVGRSFMIELKQTY